MKRMLPKPIVYVIVQRLKGVSKEELLSMGVPVGSSAFNRTNDKLVFEDLHISEWVIDSVYEIPDHYEAACRDMHRVEGDLVEWWENTGKHLPR